MNAVQLEQRISWLDEQRRKDAETIARLAERVKAQREELDGMSRRMKELTGDVSRLSAAAARLSEFENVVAAHRQDIGRELEGLEARRLEREKELEDLRGSEREDLLKRITVLDLELKGLGDIETWVEARREEELRIGRVVESVERRVAAGENVAEEHDRKLASVEEWRNQEVRRMGELLGEVSEVRSRFDELRGDLSTSLDHARRMESRLGEYVSGEKERRDSLAEWTEQQNLRNVEFERSWKEQEERFREFEKRAGEIDERMLAYVDTYRDLRQLKEELEETQERLERRIHEVSEMQRLGEDRLGQEWASFRAEDQRRWNMYKLTYDERWREHDRIHEKLGEELRAMDDNLRVSMERLAEIGESTRRRMHELLAIAREWAADIEPPPGEGA